MSSIFERFRICYFFEESVLLRALYQQNPYCVRVLLVMDIYLV